jgi:ferredoxin
MPTVVIHKHSKEPSPDARSTYELRRGLGFQALQVQNPGAPLEFDCRGADCGICIMKVRSGAENLTPPTTEEADFLKAMRADPDERLACQCRILGDVEVELEDYDA